MQAAAPARSRREAPLQAHQRPSEIFLKTRLGTTSQKAHFRCDQMTYERGGEK